MSFKGKNVLVTGASSGIGAAIAKKFADEGAKLAIVGRNREKLKSVQDTISTVGTKPVVIVADLKKEDDLRKIIHDTIKSLGCLDILVNNAGMGSNTSILQDDVMETFDKIMTTNFRSVVYLTQLAVPHLIASKGNILNISSMAAFLPVRLSFAYCSSKAALDMFTKCIASDLGAKGVRVNSINPGPVVTDMALNMGLTKEQADEAWEKSKALTTLNRVSEPEEIADLALFLTSSKAKGITGSLFVSDNGVLVKT